MATEAEIEAAARAIFDLDRSNSGRRRPHWDKELPELRDYVRSKARAALDAAASVRAKAGTEGMEIVRAVAKLRPDLLRAWTTDTSGLCGLTPDHVRQARAIVAAERKEVMPSGTRQAQDSIDTAPPTAGPIPEAGALYDAPVWDAARHQWAYPVPSPQPPAPAEGVPDVSVTIETLKTAFAALPYSRKLDATLQDIRNLATALAAKEAEIWSLREAVAHAIHDPAEVLGCTPDNEAIMEAIDTLKTRSAALEAALRPFADVAAGKALNPQPNDWDRARAALAGKES